MPEKYSLGELCLYTCTVQHRASVKISSIPAALVPSIIPVITDSLFEVVCERSRVDEKFGDPKLDLCNFYRFDERQREGVIGNCTPVYVIATTLASGC